MSQMMCDQCSEPCQKGWQMFHHKKTCKGKRQRNQCAESTTLLHDTDDVSCEVLVHDQELNGTDDVSFEGLVQDQKTNHEPVAALNAPVAHPTIVQVKRVSLSPRMKEILTFLATAERGRVAHAKTPNAGWTTSTLKVAKMPNCCPKTLEPYGVTLPRCFMS